MTGYQNDIFRHGGPIDGSGIEVIFLLGEDVQFDELTVDLGRRSILIADAPDDKCMRFDCFDILMGQLVQKHIVFCRFCETVVMKGPADHAAVRGGSV